MLSQELKPSRIVTVIGLAHLQAVTFFDIDYNKLFIALPQAPNYLYVNIDHGRR